MGVVVNILMSGGYILNVLPTFHLYLSEVHVREEGGGEGRG